MYLLLTASEYVLAHRDRKWFARRLVSPRGWNATVGESLWQSFLHLRDNVGTGRHGQWWWHARLECDMRALQCAPPSPRLVGGSAALRFAREGTPGAPSAVDPVPRTACFPPGRSAGSSVWASTECY